MTDNAPIIALIDDDPGITASLRRGLTRFSRDWTIVTFNDPRAFIEAYHSLEVDVVVSDMRMPKLSGLELIQHVRNIRPVPCIILTGSPDLTSSLYAINEISVFRYYTKPCAIELLAEGIQAAISENRPAPANAPHGQQDTSITAQLGLAALNRLALGIAVVDQDGYVQFSNQSAARIFSESDGLTLNSRGQFLASTPELTSALLGLIRTPSNTTSEAVDQTNVLAIPRPSMGRAYSVFVGKLDVERAEPNQSPLAAIFISDPDQIPLPVAEQIMKLYGLSRSQALIVQGLAEGLRLEEAASEAGITVSSARTYLKQIFSKTETSRQADLVKLVFTSPRVMSG